MQGLLIAACLITAIYGEDVRPTVPQWPTAGTFEFTMTDLNEEFELKVKSYYSAKKKAYRFDTWGGMNQAFVYCDTQTAYYYYPTAVDGSSQIECSQFSYSDEFVSPFPDLSQYKFAGNDSLYGIPSNKWVFKALFGGKQSTVWIQEREKPGSEGPFLAAADTIYYNVDNSLIENEISHPYVRYYNYVPGEPDSKVWTRPQMACTEDVDSVFLHHVTSELLGREYLILSPAAEGTSESQLRRDIYERNRRIVESHNQLPSGYKLELNRFAHLTEKELKSYTGLREGGYVETSSPFPYSDEEVERMAKQLPESWDWRTRGAVTKVKDQRECGSCWAFSTIGGLEGANFLKTGELVELSEQFLVDCFWGDEGRGCSGGLVDGALDWIMEVGGVVGEYQYGRYLAENGRCHMDKKQLIAPIKSFTQVPPNVNALKVALVHHGPIALGIAVMDEFFKYKNGVFKPSTWSFPANHGVVLVGYGVLNNDSYWLIKNSWAESWGLEGYGLISAENDTMCLLDTAFIIDMA